MENLSQEKCEACRVGVPPVSDEEMATLVLSVPDWGFQTQNEILKLERIYTFSDFVTALEFTNLIAEMAESEGHHPQIILEWGQVTVTWWTHKIKGLHRNDFIMAAKTDLIFQQMG